MGCNLFRLIHHNFLLVFSRCYNFNLIKILFLLQAQCCIFQTIGDYLNILTDDEVKDFAVTSFGEHLKYTIGKLCFNLSEEQNLRKVIGSLYIFLTTPDEVEKYI